MNDSSKSTKPKRRLKNYDFSPPARKNLASLKRLTGWTEKAVIETSLASAKKNPAAILSGKIGFVL